MSTAFSVAVALHILHFAASISHPFKTFALSVDDHVAGGKRRQISCLSISPKESSQLETGIKCASAKVGWRQINTDTINSVN